MEPTSSRPFQHITRGVRLSCAVSSAYLPMGVHYEGLSLLTTEPALFLDGSLRRGSFASSTAFFALLKARRDVFGSAIDVARGAKIPKVQCVPVAHMVALGFAFWCSCVLRHSENIRLEHIDNTSPCRFLRFCAFRCVVGQIRF